MRVDPRAARAASSALEVSALSLEVAPLRDLACYPPVGADLERLALALRGEEAVARWEVLRMRQRAHRWSALHPRLRRFYSEALARAEGRDLSAVNAGLRTILDDRPEPRGDQLRRLRRLARRLIGETSLALAPRPSVR